MTGRLFMTENKLKLFKSPSPGPARDTMGDGGYCGAHARPQPFMNFSVVKGFSIQKDGET